MFTKLLVPLDRSSLAEQALGRAAAIARAAHGGIEVVLVHEPPMFDAPLDSAMNAALLEDDEQYVQTTAAELASGAGVSATGAVVQGLPVGAICERARAVNADLVVMTTHGRTGLSRAWMGSVADGIVRQSSIPVLMLRPVEGKAAEVAAHHLFRHLLVPLDASADAAAILAPASALAACSGASMTLLQVVQPIPIIFSEAGVPFAYSASIPDDAATRELARTFEEHLAATARTLASGTGLRVRAEVVVATHVAAAIVEFARASGADAIAMSTHGRGASRLLLGSVADKVLRGSDLPLLLVRPARVGAVDAMPEQVGITSGALVF
jgi:nucleotide-binding universal stress UspA family protein